MSLADSIEHNAARLQALREQVYVLAPLEDLGHPLHDLCDQLTRSVGELRDLVREARGLVYDAADSEDRREDAAREARHAVERARRAAALIAGLHEQLTGKAAVELLDDLRRL
jgi:hypothetical protein